jgi:predicted cation transporter
MLIAGLSIIFLIVLLGPFMDRRIERNLEGFLFLMGLISATISNAWSSELVHEGLTAPISITLAVLAAGALFHYLRSAIDTGMKMLLSRTSLAWVVCFVIIALGLLSSVISAIIAALILVEFVTVLRLHRRAEVNLTVIACFAIGLGAALTPLGEPLSTIAVSKLSGEPYHATFFYLARLLGVYITASVVALGILGIFLVRSTPEDVEATLSAEAREEKTGEVFLRAFKVYLFVMALIFLGAGFKPIIDAYFTKIPPLALFWANIVSAILDNATLAAAEIGPALSEIQIKSALLGLLIAGGMLIPGNIPNIISAHSLKISSTEWARLGVPLGFVLMIITMFLLILRLV